MDASAQLYRLNPQGNCSWQRQPKRQAMSNNKPNGIHDGYQYENGKGKRSAIQMEWYGLLLHAKDSSSKRNRVEDLEFQKRSGSAI